MKKLPEILAGLILLSCVAGFVTVYATADPTTAPRPVITQPKAAPKVDTPKVTPAPAPVCPGPNCPQPNPRRPWGAQGYQSVGLGRGQGGVEIDGPVHGGVEVQADLPADQLVRNTGGSDGAGLCVGTSIMFSARLQNETELKDWQKKLQTEPGGSYPSKVDKQIAKFAPTVFKEKRYLQYEGRDFSIVKLALKTGRMPAITWGEGHMVNIVRMDSGTAAFRDNNFVGQSEIRWCSEERAKQIASGRDGRFWTVILLAPRPPACPRNGSIQTHDRIDRESYADAPQMINGPYLWQRIQGDNGPEWLLWQDGRQLGNWSLAWDRWYERLGPDRFREASLRPPAPLPDDAIEALANSIRGGVETDKLSGHERYSVAGQEISAREAFRLLGQTTQGDGLVDDTAKNHLVLIGDAAETAPVLKDLDAPEFSNLKANTLLQVYTRDDWAINPARFGFDTSGTPTIQLESPTGLVLWHENHYRGRETLIELRTKDPSYQPANDPGMPHATPADEAEGEWSSLHLGVGGLLGSIFLVSLMAAAFGTKRAA